MRDIYREKAAEVYRCKPNEVTFKMRRSVKTIYFGSMYGMTQADMQRIVDEGLKEAIRI